MSYIHTLNVEKLLFQGKCSPFKRFTFQGFHLVKRNVFYLIFVILSTLTLSFLSSDSLAKGGAVKSLETQGWIIMLLCEKMFGLKRQEPYEVGNDLHFKYAE